MVTNQDKAWYRQFTGRFQCCHVELLTVVFCIFNYETNSYNRRVHMKTVECAYNVPWPHCSHRNIQKPENIRLNIRIWQRPHLFGKIVYRNQSNVPLLSFIVFDIRIYPLGSAVPLVLSTVAVLFTSLSPLQCESQKRATFNMPSPLQWLRRGQEGQRHCLAGHPQKSTLAKTRNELLS